MAALVCCIDQLNPPSAGDVRVLRVSDILISIPPCPTAQRATLTGGPLLYGVQLATYKSPHKSALNIEKISYSPALAIPTIQASLAAVHDHQRLGVALVAHGGAGREAAVVGAVDDYQLFAVGRCSNRRCDYFTVFF